jgi:hypothetical protein
MQLHRGFLSLTERWSTPYQSLRVRRRRSVPLHPAPSVRDRVYSALQFVRRPRSCFSARLALSKVRRTCSRSGPVCAAPAGVPAAPVCDTARMRHTRGLFCAILRPRAQQRRGSVHGVVLPIGTGVGTDGSAFEQIIPGPIDGTERLSPQRSAEITAWWWHAWH